MVQLYLSALVICCFSHYPTFLLTSKVSEENNHFRGKRETWTGWSRKGLRWASQWWIEGWPNQERERGSSLPECPATEVGVPGQFLYVVCLIFENKYETAYLIKKLCRKTGQSVTIKIIHLSNYSPDEKGLIELTPVLHLWKFRCHLLCSINKTLHRTYTCII